MNLNNHTKLDSDLIDELIVALTENIYLEKLQLANIRFTEDHAIVSSCSVYITHTHTHTQNTSFFFCNASFSYH